MKLSPTTVSFQYRLVNGVTGFLYWRKRQQSRAAVELAIQDLVWQLPKCYTDTLCQQKSADVYQHVYDSYYGAGQSVYAVVG